VAGEGTASVPPRCTVCGTDIPAGQSRCPGCGRVFGEDNRCPSCHAIAAVRPRGAGFVCAACGAPRTRLPGTVVQGDGGTGPTGATLSPSAVAGGLLRAMGAASIAVGILLGAIGAAFAHGFLGWVVAAVLAASGVGLGALLLRLGARARGRALAARREAGERRIVALAERHGGVLTATQLAQELGMGVAAADAALTALADGSRVTVELTDDGLIEYHFRELQHAHLPRVRVAPSVGDAEAAVEVSRDASRDERERGA